MSAYRRVLDALAARDKTVRDRGSSAMAQCPAHDDREPSLSIKRGEDGIGIHCFAGCSVEEIVAALGLEKRDLFDSRSRVRARLAGSGSSSRGQSGKRERQAGALDTNEGGEGDRECRPPSRVRAGEGCIDFLGNRERVARALRMSVEGESRCPLPGHTGEARLEEREGDLRLVCECRQSAGWRPLGEVWEAITTRHVRKPGKASNGGTPMRNGSRWVWLLLFAAGAEILLPLPVYLPAMSREPTPAERRVMEFFEQLLGLYHAAGSDRPVAFGASFVALHCDISRQHAAEVIRELVREDVIEHIDTLDPIRGHLYGLRLYLPGLGRRRRPHGASPVEAGAGVEVIEAAKPRAEVRDKPLVPEAQIAPSGLDGLDALEGAAPTLLDALAEPPADVIRGGHTPDSTANENRSQNAGRVER